MLYDVELKKSIISSLEDRELIIVNFMVAIANEGYIINNNKKVILSFSSILIHAFENIDVFNKEQHEKLETLFNKIQKL